MYRTLQDTNEVDSCNLYELHSYKFAVRESVTQKKQRSLNIKCNVWNLNRYEHDRCSLHSKQTALQRSRRCCSFAICMEPFKNEKIWNDMDKKTKITKVKHSQLFTNTLKQFSHMHCSSKPFHTLLTGDAPVNNCANQECFKNNSIL